MCSAISHEAVAAPLEGSAVLSGQHGAGRFYPKPAKMGVVDQVPAAAMPRAA